VHRGVVCLAAILPSDQDARLKQPTAANSQNARSVRVFISYSHVDARYLEQQDSILSYISGLQREGFSFWHDRRINAGVLWDAEIKCQIDQSDVALILVSQAFFNSVYCQNVEVSSFVAARSQKGLRLVPILIIISACDWMSVEWLREIQMLPRDGKNIEQHLAKRGQRMACYLEILETLRSAKAVGNSAS
jgi:TIR domain